MLHPLPATVHTIHLLFIPSRDYSEYMPNMVPFPRIGNIIPGEASLHWKEGRHVEQPQARHRRSRRILFAAPERCRSAFRQAKAWYSNTGDDKSHTYSHRGRYTH